MHSFKIILTGMRVFLMLPLRQLKGFSGFPKRGRNQNMMLSATAHSLSRLSHRYAQVLSFKPHMRQYAILCTAHFISMDEDGIVSHIAV